jgi:KpsF/GutQ family protein
MINQESQEALKAFIDISKEEFNAFADTIQSGSYEKAVQLIVEAQKSGNRVHITGIGKPSHVANYMASLLSSTGTPTYFLHGTEAVHGSCGQLIPGDVVICISNSGETAELKATVTAIKNNDCKVISVTGNPESWLGKQGDACLFAGIQQEGGPLNRAPRTSILAEILVLQGLSVVLQATRGLTPEEYVKWHPGGTLGHLRENEVK